MKTNLIFLILISSLATFSCGKDTGEVNSKTGLVLNEKIVVDGADRAYHIQIPTDSKNKPLVVLLHGHGGSFDQSLGLEGSQAPQKVWLDIANREEFIVVVPNGELGPSDSRGWNDCRSDAPANPTTDDVKFISAVIEKLKGELNHDDNKVYVSGVSNGASMAIRLAQEIPDKIAAFASVITTMPVNSECLERMVPISALFMNGTSDPIAPYEGGSIASNRGEVHSTQASIEYWIERNKTDRDAIVTSFSDIISNDESTAKKYVYPNGLANTEVVLYEITGGGHTEPSLLEHYSNLYLRIVGPQNRDIEMAEEIWNFFKTKSK